METKDMEVIQGGTDMFEERIEALNKQHEEWNEENRDDGKRTYTVSEIHLHSFPSQ